MEIREATAGDWPAIWPFFRQIVAAGETFTYPTDLTEEKGRAWWLLPEPNRTVVAVDTSGAVLGTAKMNNNHPRLPGFSRRHSPASMTGTRTGVARMPVRRPTAPERRSAST